jgi:demethylmenaquinone methyltransferase/2-methoxy-6-polyprenyl-1,4-benzoquinol methylase
VNPIQSSLSLDRPTSTARVRSMFDAIAARYDLLNTILSGGMHRVWEQRLVSSVPAIPDGVCLDLCTGTGALIPRLSSRYARVEGVDISPQMLERARVRWRTIGNVSWTEGDAQALECKDNTFDVVTVAYGVRNWPERERGLREITRVLKARGYVGILEFGQPTNRMWRSIFNFYSRSIIPFIGGLVSGNREAYEYLPKTSAAFPCGEAFAALLSEAGLEPVSISPLLGGVAFIYVAQKRS